LPEHRSELESVAGETSDNDDVGSIWQSIEDEMFVGGHGVVATAPVPKLKADFWEVTRKKLFDESTVLRIRCVLSDWWI
jgi:hypothetical protein